MKPLYLNQIGSKDTTIKVLRQLLAEKDLKMHFAYYMCAWLALSNLVFGIVLYRTVFL